MPVLRSTGRPHPKNLETGDILWLPHHLRVPDSSGEGSRKNPFRLTGHVAIIFFKDKEKADKNIPDHPVPKDHPRAVPYVVEAVKNAKKDKDNDKDEDERISEVREISYNDWSPHFATFWHGRIKKPSADGLVALSQKDQMDFVTEALHHLGKSYSALLGPSLDDDGADARFSCSKLILVAAWKALKIPLDGKQGPKRWLPCVAKSLKKSPYIFDVPPPPPPLP